MNLKIHNNRSNPEAKKGFNSIQNDSNHRESCWTESIAIGSSNFVEDIKVKLGIKAVGRRIEEQNEGQYVLRVL